jgi:hypothetical protein
MPAGYRRVISECSVEVGDHPELRLSASAGLVRIGRDTPSDEAVLAEVDRAMYAEEGQETPQGP